MIIFKYSNGLQSYLQKARRNKRTVGFVPTMGALHKGHLSLLDESKVNNDISLCSIFVNPVQFNNREDFIKYPSTIESDILMLEEKGCDLLFIPSEKEMYPTESSKNGHYDLGNLEKVLEGKFRPGHFQGVCTIVEKLLDIVQPDRLYLGQKDYQQCLVVNRLIKLLNKNMEVIICPIIREASGLAMSSRNLRLNEDERKLATQLYKTLVFIKDNITVNNFSELKEKAVTDLEMKGFKVDYLELADTSNLELLKNCEDSKGCIILIAAYLNEIRLIDNFIIKS